ncbi:hypothetical protein EDD22DRAFT_1008142 [Suillus occidentalis]|nr:hypothetical protein EDD22DRAFT_1008142 [Suillus occidentalis]
MSQSNFFTATVKQVSKMTGKAKATLEEKTIWTSSKKCKPEVNGETINTQPKKAKMNQPADTTPTGVSPPLTSPISVTSVTSTPPPTDKSRRAVVRMEEEEALYADSADAGLRESDEESQSGVIRLTRSHRVDLKFRKVVHITWQKPEEITGNDWMDNAADWLSNEREYEHHSL